MLLGTTLGYHLARRFLFAIFAMFLLTIIIIVMANYLDQVRMFFGSDRYSLGKGFLVSLFGAPSTAETILPFAVLFGSILTLAITNRRLEFTIVRSAGVSVWRFLLPGGVVALVVGTLAITAFDPLAAALKQRSVDISTEILPPGWLGTPSGSSFWLRQRSGAGSSILGANQTTDGGFSLAGVTAFIYDADGGLTERIDANAAHLDGDQWVIPNARVTPSGKATEVVAEYRLPTSLSGEEIRESLADPDTLPLWRLPELIRIAQESSLPANGLKLRFQALLQLPLLLFAMVLIAGVVSLRFSRTFKLGRMFTIGAAAGFSLYIITESAKALGRGGVVAPGLAAWLPAVLACILSATVLLYAEDG